jgi:outer membrane protein
MKRIVLIVTALVIGTIAANAQTKPLKIGYTNVDYVVSLMPESKAVESELKTYRDQLESQYNNKVKEFQEKYAAYEKGAATMADIVRADKEKELQNMQAQIEEFQKNAEVSIQKKQAALLEPVLDKVQKTINAVAEENGFTYIFNSDAGYGTTPILLYGPEKDNVSDIVLKKLGITPPAETKKEATPAKAPAKK